MKMKVDTWFIQAQEPAIPSQNSELIQRHREELLVKILSTDLINSPGPMEDIRFVGHSKKD